MYFGSTQQSKAIFRLPHFIMKLLHTTLNSLSTVANNHIFKMRHTTGVPSCPQPFYHACVLEKHWGLGLFCLNTYELLTSTALKSVAMACNVKSNTDFLIDEKYQ